MIASSWSLMVMASAISNPPGNTHRFASPRLSRADLVAMRLGLPRVAWKWSPSSRPAPCAPKRNGFILRPRSDGSRILCQVSPRSFVSVCLLISYCCAVWMHVPAADRTRAFRKPITLLKPGGFIAIYTASRPCGARAPHLRRLAAKLKDFTAGAFVEIATESKDKLGRGALNWTQLVVRLPDDGTGRAAVASFGLGGGQIGHCHRASGWPSTRRNRRPGLCIGASGRHPGGLAESEPSRILALIGLRPRSSHQYGTNLQRSGSSDTSPVW